MGRKKDFNYFEAFVDLSKYSLEAAKLLNDTLNNFNTMLLPDKIKEMHEIEHSADLAKHKVINRLFKEFLPPIEREDIISLSQKIDDITDAVEDVLISIDIYNVKSIPPEILEFTNLIVECCNSIHKALLEFQNFKKSKELPSLIIKVNSLEEEGDALYVNAVRKMYRSSKDPITLMIWTEVLQRLEICCDACEDVADDIESVVMKNS
jgi:predicted phosphate transport protein (TIGR00153 family)